MPASYATHRAQIKAILSSWGMIEENAETTAEILSWADLHGVDSHGMSMLPGYDNLRRTGRARMDARPKIVRESPVSALVGCPLRNAPRRSEPGSRQPEQYA